MLRNGKILLSFALGVLAFGCGYGEKDDALAQIDAARRQLATLAPHGRTGLARDSIRIAREALLEAESLVRRNTAWSELFARDPSWHPHVERALDNVEIASWVVERQREAQREETQAFLDSAAGAVQKARKTGLSGVHHAVATNLRRAQVTLDEARRLLDAGEFHLAREKAREAADLAGELPPETKALFARFDNPANLRQWRKWVEKGIKESRKKPALVVDKRAHMAVLFIKGKPARWFDVELGYNGLMRKLRQGDGATPEGLYHVTRRKGRGQTKYYKAFLLDYPNGEDKKRFKEAKKNGSLKKGASIGDLIEVHGDGGRGNNWTDGCVAVKNADMDYLFQKLVVGSAVVIVGSYEGLGDDEGGIGGNK